MRALRLATATYRIDPALAEGVFRHHTGEALRRTWEVIASQAFPELADPKSALSDAFRFLVKHRFGFENDDSPPDRTYRIARMAAELIAREKAA